MISERLVRAMKWSFLRVYTVIYARWHGVKIGRGSIVHPGAVLVRHDGGTIRIGQNCEFSKGAMVLTFGGDIEIGDDVTVQPYSVLYGHGGLRIGNGVRVATHCVLIPANHRFDDLTKPIFKQGLTMRGIQIEDDVWVGAGARILDGVTVRRGCVIATGAVVTRSTEPLGIYGGVPAHKLRERA